MPREIVSIADREPEGYAVVTVADGDSEHRRCTLWEATELAGAADLPIALAHGDLFRWERRTKPGDGPKA